MFKRLVTVLIFFALGFVPQFGYAQTVRISYSGTSGQNLTFWVAYEAGLFKKYGLNTELIFIAGGSTNIQGLLANEIGFAHVGGSSPIQAILQGAEIVILATSYGLMPYGLVTGKTIHSPGDLKGKKIAITRLGGIEEAAARFAMEKLGVGARNVTLVQSGPDAVRIAAVESGAASATMLAPPALFAATSRGLNMLADLGSLKVNYPTSTVVARRSYLAQERPVAKKFLMAFVEGLHLYKQKKSFAIQVLQKYTKLSNQEILSQTYDYFVQNTALVPLTDPAAVQNGLPTDKPSGRKVEEFFDNSLLEELVQEGFVKKIAKETR